MPYRAIEKNDLKLKQNLIDLFPGVFKRSTLFKEMKNKPKHIHLRRCHARHSPSLITPNSRKTVFGATDGYHAIPLDEESRHLTTFITE